MMNKKNSSGEGMVHAGNDRRRIFFHSLCKYLHPGFVKADSMKPSCERYEQRRTGSGACGGDLESRRKRRPQQQASCKDRGERGAPFLEPGVECDLQMRQDASYLGELSWVGDEGLWTALYRDPQGRSKRRRRSF